MFQCIRSLNSDSIFLVFSFIILEAYGNKHFISCVVFSVSVRDLPFSQSPVWRTNPYRPSDNVFSVYSQLLFVHAGRLRYPQPEVRNCRRDGAQLSAEIWRRRWEIITHFPMKIQSPWQSIKSCTERARKNVGLHETPTLCNTVQALFLQGHSTCFGRKRPSSGVLKLVQRPLVHVLSL